MKLPLTIGIPLLILLLLASGYTPYGEGKKVLLLLAMGVALWTAFSLPKPGRGMPPEPPEEDEEEEPPLVEGPPGEEPHPPHHTRGPGWRRPRQGGEGEPH